MKAKTPDHHLTHLKSSYIGARASRRAWGLGAVTRSMTISSSSSFNANTKRLKASSIISLRLRIKIMHSSLFLRCRHQMTRFASISLSMSKFISLQPNATTSILLRDSAKQRDANHGLGPLLRTAKRESEAKAHKFEIRKTSKGQQTSWT